MNRRIFLGLGAGVGIGASLATLRAQATTTALSLTERTLKIENLPQGFHGYRIAFVSDVHLGTCVDIDFVSSVASRISSLKPDLVLHGGDYLWRQDSRLSQLALSLARKTSCTASTEENAAYWYDIFVGLFGSIPAVDGHYGVLGNHDRGIGRSVCEKAFTSRGMRLLVNDSATIKRGKDSLRIIGYDDYWTGTPTTPRLDSRSDKTECRLVLCHNPDYFTRLLSTETLDFDVGLAGHTHGGQIKLPQIGAIMYNIRDQRFGEDLWQGTNALGQARQVFTTRGIGTAVIPLRVNCEPEIALLTLSRK